MRRSHPRGLMPWVAFWALLLAGPAMARQVPGEEKVEEVTPADDVEEAQPEPGADPSTTEESSLQVVRVHFRGNRKVEDDALRVNLRTVPGTVLTSDVIRDDVRTIWKMGFFEDVQVEVTSVPGGLVVVYVVKEKPSIRKIYVSGHDEIGLTKVNEVLDIKKEQILDVSNIKKNAEKIREVYVQRGFYMADVDYELRREAPGEVDVYFRVRENGKVEVRRVNFVGNRQVGDAELRAVMLTQPGDLLSFLTSAGTYREDVFQRDILLLQSHYWDRGYINVKIAEPQMELSADKRHLYIRINIEEGQRYRIGDIEVKGDLLQPREFYLAQLKVKSGEMFNRSRLTQDVQQLTEHYQDQGYFSVNAIPETRVDEKKRIVHLSYNIEKGNKAVIARINIRGNTKTRDKVIRREMRIAEGETYSKTKIQTSRDRINRLGFFERVDVSEKLGATDGQMEVNVEVSERQTGSFQIGAGFSSVESFIAQAQISQNNLFGRGQLLTLQAQISGLRQLFMLQFEDPYFLDTNVTFGFNLFNQQRFYLSFTRRSVGGSLTWGYMLTDDLRAFATYTLQDVSVNTSGRSNLFSGGQRSPIPEGSLANLLRSGVTSSVRLSLAHDTRNDRLFTTRGWYNTASAEFAEGAFGSQNQFGRYDATLRYFRPLIGPLVLRLKADTGLIVSRDPQGVPIYERYFVGGIFDVRGFQPFSLGPQIQVPLGQSPDAGLNTFRIGGNLQVVGKAEIEVPIFQKVGIRGVIFTDIGNAYNLEKQYCRLRPPGVHPSQDPCTNSPTLDSLRSSWGLGFRWFSPIGPLRFEWGFPFKTLPGEQPSIFEFTIGNDL